METVALHGPRLGVGRLCAALVVPRATYYRHLDAQEPARRPTPDEVNGAETCLTEMRKPCFE
jgi:hypothetical protein